MAKIEGNGKPNNYTVGKVGDRYIDLNTTFEYVCDLAYDSTAPGDDPYYIWRLLEQEISSGGGQPLEILLQDKTFTENGSYSADEGYDGLGNVVVDVASSGGEDLLAARLNGTLTEYSSNDVESVPTQAFVRCSSLKTINLPACTEVGSEAFRYCTSLELLSLPLCETIDGSYAFSGCKALMSINLPACTKIGSNAFGVCSSLSEVVLPLCIYLYSGAFYGCVSLTKIYMLSSDVCIMQGSTVFKSTPIASGTGSIFVPASLVDAYKSATNWTYFSNVIYAYEETT